jgi:RNA recognition motif-containing protein
MSSEPTPPSGSTEAPAASESPPKDSAAGATSGAPETNTLWVGNLPFNVGEGDVMALFAPHGALDCALARAAPRSYAFVLFRSPSQARAAVEATRGTKVKGAAMRTEFARPVVSPSLRLCMDLIPPALDFPVAMLFLRIVGLGSHAFSHIVM